MASRIATRIEKERVAREWSYRELATALGVSLSQAHDWAKGNGEPRIKNIKRISKKLGIPMAELLAELLA